MAPLSSLRRMIHSASLRATGSEIVASVSVASPGRCLRTSSMTLSSALTSPCEVEAVAATAAGTTCLRGGGSAARGAGAATGRTAGAVGLTAAVTAGAGAAWEAGAVVRAFGGATAAVALGAALGATFGSTWASALASALGFCFAASFPALKPVALAFFGGYMDFNSPNLVVRLIGGAIKKDLEKKGIDTSKPYDTRDFAAIRKWAEDVAAKAR